MAHPFRFSRLRPSLLALTLAAATASLPLPVAGGRPAPALAQACPVVSGYVYHDADNNGLKDAGEAPIAGNPVELRTATGAVIARATTDGDGYYQFSVDETANAPLQTQSQSLTFPTATTDWTSTKSAPQFNPSLGTLKSLTITSSGSITSAIRAESLDSVATTVSATVSGTLVVTAPGGRELTAAPTVNAGAFEAAAFDGVADFGGPSGYDFGAHTANDSNVLTLTDASSLAPYIGGGSVSFVASVAASSRTTGSGNVLNQINTTAGAQLLVVYQYQPAVCLPAGAYTIVQREQPPTYTDGRDTAGNVTPLPGSDRSDSIPVSLGGGDRPNNNFGELRASISGYVYVDSDDDGSRDSGEAPIAGVTIRLAGTDSSGASVDQATSTDSSGFYAFRGLLAGTYALTETQPAAYADGKDTIGTPGGKSADDRHYDISLPAGFDGVNNNFGERTAATATATPTATSTSSDATPATPAATTPGGSGTTGGTVSAGSPPPVSTVAGARTPGAPSTGSGFLEAATGPSALVVGLAVFAASGWLAFLAIQRRRTET